MDEAFLNRWFPGEPHHIDVFYREAERVLPEQGRVLDLGCGDNTSLERFRRPGLEVWGADFQAHPQLRHPDWFRRLGPEGGIPFADEFFCVVSTLWVLEHVARPQRFLQEVSRVLRPGGCLIAHSISGTHYVAWARRLLGLLPHATLQGLVRRLYGRAEHDTFPTRYRLNSAAQLRRCAGPAGLSLTHLQRYSDLGWYFRFSPTLRRLAVASDWFLEKVSPGWGRIYFTAILHKPVSGQQRRAA